MKTPLDNLLPIPEEYNHIIKSIVEILLCYAQFVYGTMLESLDLVAELHAHPNQKTEAAIKHSLEYSKNNLEIAVNCLASDIVIQIDSNSS